ncbi:MAG: NTP transferase domain-containing protein, partial [Cytophagaceae bacterium]|nr:NTP transferase domain-containing protein [Cytophagaceae bacterium]
MQKSQYAVIMAGGIGSRFWPFSRAKYPKQFHDVLGTGKSLLQQTVKRLEPLVAHENILVVTNQDYIS